MPLSGAALSWKQWKHLSSCPQDAKDGREYVLGICGCCWAGTSKTWSNEVIPCKKIRHYQEMGGMEVGCWSNIIRPVHCVLTWELSPHSWYNTNLIFFLHLHRFLLLPLDCRNFQDGTHVLLNFIVSSIEHTAWKIAGAQLWVEWKNKEMNEFLPDVVLTHKEFKRSKFIKV